MPDAKDYAELAKKLLAAAQKGNSQAQYHLGVLFNDGKGVTKDYKQAASWYLKAANQGHQKAQLYLGLLFLNGRGVTKDFKQAAQWFTKSAEQGEQKSQYYLGLLYYKGAGVAKDLEHAVHWLELSANQGNKDAQKILDEIMSLLDVEPEDIDPYDEANDSFDDAPQKKPSRSVLGKILSAILGLVVLAGAAGGGYYYFFIRKPKTVAHTRESAREQRNDFSRSDREERAERNSDAPQLSPYQLQENLFSAVKKSDVNKILELLRDNADPNFNDDDDISLLQNVVMAEDEKLSRDDKRRIISAMIRNGADVNYHGGMNGAGICTSTALSLAVQNDDPEIAAILLDAGADPNIQDDNEKSAADYANMLRNSSAIKKSPVFSRLKPRQSSGSNRQQTSAPNRNARTERTDRSNNNRDTASDEQLNELLRAKKVPDYVRDSGTFYFNPAYKDGFVEIDGENVRLRSQPNTQSRVIASGRNSMWVEGHYTYYLGEWTNPKGERWVLADYEGYKNGKRTKLQPVWIFGRYTGLRTKEDFDEMLRIEFGN